MIHCNKVKSFQKPINVQNAFIFLTYHKYKIYYSWFTEPKIVTSSHKARRSTITNNNSNSCNCSLQKMAPYKLE